MNAHQRRLVRRGTSSHVFKSRVTLGGFVDWISDEWPLPEPFRGTGDLITYMPTKVLYVSIEGSWHACPKGKYDAKAKVRSFFRKKVCS